MLKQSPHAWFAKLSDLLSLFSFTSHTVDPTMLTKKTKEVLSFL